MMSKSPMKGGAMNLLGGGGGIQAILAAAGQAAKSGLTADNKNLRKMDKGGGLAGAKSVNSRGTRRTGGDATSKSRKSRFEEDFESMEIEEVQILIENAEREMKLAADAKRKIQRVKSQTAKAKDAKLQPLENALT